MKTQTIASIIAIGLVSAATIPATANTGQTGLNGADNNNSTGTVIDNKGGTVKVNNKSEIDNTQNNFNNNSRKFSDDINNKADSASGSNSGSNIEDNSSSTSKQYTYFQPSAQTGQVGTYQFQVQLPNGEQVIVACPTKNTNFNVGSVFGGLGFGKSSDKLPKDCVQLVQRSQQRYSMYDAMRASCHLGPGYFQSFNKHLFASSMAEIKGTTLTDELRLMRTASVNVEKVSALNTYNAFCKVNLEAVDQLKPIPQRPTYTPTPTKVPQITPTKILN